MDFANTYTEEQEEFRQEVRTWLEEKIPEDMMDPIDNDDLTDEHYWFWREKHKELGKKGWLFPTYPAEYGGGGLTGEHEAIIEEEFQRYRVPRAVTMLVLNAILVWGTEEQKKRFLIPFMRGEQYSWQKYTEPHSGADLASYETRAVRDGDDWLITGSNTFTTGRGGHPDWLHGPAVTDPDAPRHRNLGFFMIPVPSEGLDIRPLKLVQGSEQHFIYLDNVRVPGENLIGGDHEGWQVTNTTLEQEHGGRGQAYHRDEVVDNLVTYMQEKPKKGDSPGRDPVIQQAAISAYIDAHIDGLFEKRTYWMYQNRLEMSWEGSTSSLFNRQYHLRNVTRVRDIMGMYAQLGSHDPQAPFGGENEFFQRNSFVLQHGAGSLNITKVVVARRIGISRTKERPAPTPMTATAAGG